MTDAERRKYRRLTIRLPLECRRVGAGQENSFRTVTVNVSTGGLYFETDIEDIQAGTLLHLELTVPPGDGHWPYPGRVSTVAEVVRVSPAGASKAEEPRATRIGVATQFRDRLKLSF